MYLPIKKSSLSLKKISTARSVIYLNIIDVLNICVYGGVEGKRERKSLRTRCAYRINIYSTTLLFLSHESAASVYNNNIINRYRLRRRRRRIPLEQLLNGAVMRECDRKARILLPSGSPGLLGCVGMVDNPRHNDGIYYIDEPNLIRRWIYCCYYYYNYYIYSMV